MTKIYLIRHAQSLGNVNVLSGNGFLPKTEFGSPLSELGKQQAKQLVSNLAELPFSAIYSSHLHRALDTIKETAEEKNLAVNIIEDLREIEEDHETNDQALCRFLSILTLIGKKHKDEIVLVISHGVLLKLLLHNLLPADFPMQDGIIIENLAQVVLEFKDDFKVITYKGIDIAQT